MSCYQQDYDHNGDCDGTVRTYVAQRGGVVPWLDYQDPPRSGLAAHEGERVRLCRSHAGMLGGAVRRDG